MPKKRSSTKSRIVKAAWNLFYKNGYDQTTVEDIINASKTSKGTFYHYFKGKEALLNSLSDLFDEKYEQLEKEIDDSFSTIETLLFLNRKLFEMIENTVDLELMKRLYSTQLVTKNEKQLLDHNRVYYRLLRKIVIAGQERNEIVKTMSVNEIVKYYAFCERAIIYDWCLCNGDYSLSDSASKMMPLFMKRIEA